MKSQSIKVGKFYTTKQGETVRCAADCGKGIFLVWAADSQNPIEVTSRDIVAEAADPAQA